jgi:GNAT superfamily N-acetyltransferase
MTPDPLTELDNPAWNALNGRQQEFATGVPPILRYRQGVLPFAACESGRTENIDALDHLMEPGEIFYLIGELPPLPSHWELVKELPCAQMILRRPVVLQENTVEISLLTAGQDSALFNLINKVQPGFYKPGAHQLGDYYGVWENDRLVAVAGERMRVEHATEISGICTDPDYTGRRYAQHLIARLCNKNLEQGMTPFLHVLQANPRAIRLYEYLGFETRRAISFWQLRLSR